MEDNVYIPRDVRFSENVIGTLDLRGSIWLAITIVVLLISIRTVWSLIGITGTLLSYAIIIGFTYMYHSEYPGRNPLRTRDILRPMITFFVNQRLNYQLVDVIAKMPNNQYISLSVEKIKPIFTPKDAETEFIL